MQSDQYPEIVKTGRVIPQEAAPDPPQSIATLCGELAARLCASRPEVDRNDLAMSLEGIVEEFFAEYEDDEEEV
jgi:hypothetical protein